MGYSKEMLEIEREIDEYIQGSSSVFDAMLLAVLQQQMEEYHRRENEQTARAIAEMKKNQTNKK